jgi:hypothetical protein
MMKILAVAAVVLLGVQVVLLGVLVEAEHAHDPMAVFKSGVVTRALIVNGNDLGTDIANAIGRR